jgi:hypothetical protein
MGFGAAGLAAAFFGAAFLGAAFFLLVAINVLFTVNGWEIGPITSACAM